MIWTLAATIGALVAVASYLIMQRRIIQVALGMAVLSHAANLMIVASGWVGDGKAPIVPKKDGFLDPYLYVDPLPQAMVLTAIVISFGVQAFAMVLAYRAYQTVGTDDLDDMKATDT